jgi:hypothetical protein
VLGYGGSLLKGTHPRPHLPELAATRSRRGFFHVNVIQIYNFTVTAAEHTIRMRARIKPGGNASRLFPQAAATLEVVAIGSASSTSLKPHHRDDPHREVALTLNLPRLVSRLHFFEPLMHLGV